MYRSLLLVLLFCASACSAGEPTTRSVSVSGTGSATAVADGAIVQMSINSRAKQLDEAQAGAARVTASVLRLAEELGIPKDRIDTTGASVRPDYRWDRDSEQQLLRGYIADRQMTVRLEDLDMLARLIEGAVAAGVNQVSPPQLTSTREKAAYREALKMAAEDARASARVLATTLGAKLGAAITISAGAESPRPPVPVMRMAEASMADAAATYNPGDLSFRATVNATFALSD